MHKKEDINILAFILKSYPTERLLENETQEYIIIT